MTLVDFVIIGILLLSCVISVIRGFVKESISMATWVLAVIVAMMFAGKLSILLEDTIENPAMRQWISAAALFMLTLLVGGLANFMISALVKGSGLTGTDRTLGVAFGLLRGIVVVAVLVLLAGLTPFPKEDFWVNSALVPHFEEIAMWIRELLPGDMASMLQFQE